MNLSGMEEMIFSTAYYKITDFNKVAEFFKTLNEKEIFSIDKFDEETKKIDGAFLRLYPKNHWNPLAKSPTAKQVVGSASAINDVLKLETMTRSRLRRQDSL